MRFPVVSINVANPIVQSVDVPAGMCLDPFGKQTGNLKVTQ
jgi:hypothetical protein